MYKVLSQPVSGIILARNNHQPRRLANPVSGIPGQVPTAGRPPAPIPSGVHVHSPPPARRLGPAAHACSYDYDTYRTSQVKLPKIKKDIADCIENKISFREQRDYVLFIRSEFGRNGKSFSFIQDPRYYEAILELYENIQDTWLASRLTDVLAYPLKHSKTRTEIYFYIDELSNRVQSGTLSPVVTFRLAKILVMIGKLNPENMTMILGMESSSTVARQFALGVFEAYGDMFDELAGQHKNPADLLQALNDTMAILRNAYLACHDDTDADKIRGYIDTFLRGVDKPNIGQKMAVMTTHIGELLGRMERNTGAFNTRTYELLADTPSINTELNRYLTAYRKCGNDRFRAALGIRIVTIIKSGEVDADTIDGVIRLLHASLKKANTPSENERARIFRLLMMFNRPTKRCGFKIKAAPIRHRWEHFVEQNPYLVGTVATVFVGGLDALLIMSAVDPKIVLGINSVLTGGLLKLGISTRSPETGSITSAIISGITGKDWGNGGSPA